MPSLENLGHRFESEFYTVAGYPFTGTIMPLDEGSIASYDFTEPRLILRVDADCPVHTGTIMMDNADRKFILANHDSAGVYNAQLYRSHRLFQINNTVLWQREGTGTTDTLTGLKRSTGLTTMGNIDVLIELYGREEMDTTIRVKEQRRRLVTVSPIQLGDVVDGMTVRRLDEALGIWVAEIE